MASIGGLQTTTDYKIILPFYAYAAVSILVGTVLLLFNTDVLELGFHHPHILAITHVMTLGWGTMTILGASYQLLPVLIEGELESDFLGYLTFILSAIGIPILVIGFYIFHTGWVLKTGAVIVNLGVLCYVVNVLLSSFKSKKRNVHAWFILTASLWLFSTTFYGLLLVWNFNTPFLGNDSWNYLTIHAHLGLIGWFLLLVVGVGSRLIPLFMISKYANDKLLWWIYALVNLSLVSFLFFRGYRAASFYYYISIMLVLIGVILFIIFCFKARKGRIRKNVDEQVKASLISVTMMLLPILTLITVLFILPASNFSNIVLLYGFCILFGWITAIIFGMTFKTLPFIVWSKVYKGLGHTGRIPAPKDMFSDRVFSAMIVSYLSGFVLFSIGLIILNQILLKIGTIALVLAAFLYLYNVSKTLFHKQQLRNK